MNKIIKSILIALAIGTTSLIAGNDHSHGAHGHSHHKVADVNQTIAKENSIKILNSFVQKNVIDKSWLGIEVDSAKTEVINGSKEWVIIFKNDKITEEKKQKLFVFLTLGGEYIASNYTGN